MLPARAGVIVMCCHPAGQCFALTSGFLCFGESLETTLTSALGSFHMLLIALGHWKARTSGRCFYSISDKDVVIPSDRWGEEDPVPGEQTSPWKWRRAPPSTWASVAAPHHWGCAPCPWGDAGLGPCPITVDMETLEPVQRGAGLPWGATAAGGRWTLGGADATCGWDGSALEPRALAQAPAGTAKDQPRDDWCQKKPPVGSWGRAGLGGRFGACWKLWCRCSLLWRSPYLKLWIRSWSF